MRAARSSYYITTTTSPSLDTTNTYTTTTNTNLAVLSLSLSLPLCSRGANEKVAFLSLGCEVDGTLHVRAIKADGFVASAAAALSPGDELRVRVKDVDVERRKARGARVARARAPCSRGDM